MPQILNVPGSIPAGARIKRDIFLLNQIEGDPGE